MNGSDCVGGLHTQVCVQEAVHSRKAGTRLGISCSGMPCRSRCPAAGRHFLKRRASQRHALQRHLLEGRLCFGGAAYQGGMRSLCAPPVELQLHDVGVQVIQQEQVVVNDILQSRGAEGQRNTE